MNRRALFLFGCILAIVGGGAVPGPAGITMLVFGILVALGVAASAFFKAADCWSEGTEKGTPRSGPPKSGRLGSFSRRRSTSSRPSLRGGASRPGELPRSKPGKPPIPERKPEPPSRQLPG